MRQSAQGQRATLHGEQSKVHLTCRVIDLKVAHKQGTKWAPTITDRVVQLPVPLTLCAQTSHDKYQFCNTSHFIHGVLSLCRDLAKQSEASVMLFKNTVRTEQACRLRATQDGKIMMTRWLNISKIVRRVPNETTSSLVTART